MALGVFLYSRIPAVYADSPIQQGQLKTQFQNLIKGFGKTNYSYMREAYSGLKQFTQSGGKYSFITGVIRNISAGLGTVFVIVYFLFSIVRETQKGDTSSEMWLRTCAARRRRGRDRCCHTEAEGRSRKKDGGGVLSHTGALRG